MVQTAGRPISPRSGFCLMRNGSSRFHAQQRLAAMLDDSRKFQNQVNERLAEQVLHALYELLRGFQAATMRRRASFSANPLLRTPTRSIALS